MWQVLTGNFDGWFLFICVGKLIFYYSQSDMPSDSKHLVNTDIPDQTMNQHPNYLYHTQSLTSNWNNKLSCIEMLLVCVAGCIDSRGYGNNALRRETTVCGVFTECQSLYWNIFSWLGWAQKPTMSKCFELMFRNLDFKCTEPNQSNILDFSYI